MDDNIWDAAALVIFVTFIFLLLKDIWRYLIIAIIILLILFFICLFFILKRKKKAFKDEEKEEAEKVEVKVKEEVKEEKISKEDLKREIKEEVKKEMASSYMLSNGDDFNTVISSNTSGKSLIEKFAYYLQSMISMEESASKLAKRFKNEKIKDKYYEPVLNYKKDIEAYLALPLDSVSENLVDNIELDANNLKEAYLDLYEAYKNNNTFLEETTEVKEEKEEVQVVEVVDAKKEEKPKTKTTKKKTTKKSKTIEEDQDVINPFNYKKENEEEDYYYEDNE